MLAKSQLNPCSTNPFARLFVGGARDPKRSCDQCVHHVAVEIVRSLESGGEQGSSEKYGK